VKRRQFLSFLHGNQPKEIKAVSKLQQEIELYIAGN
jgi:hypothetical protein